ncbi:MAG TPA: cyanophycinase [Gemmatimonadaceae bacterium]
MPTLRTLPALLLALACAPPSSAARDAGPAPAAVRAAADSVRGHLFIVGGGPRPDTLMRRFVELAGGPGRARIVVFGMASADTGAGSYAANGLRRLGADAVALTIGREEAMRDSVARLLDGATGVWFGGGDQSRLTAAIGGTPVETAIHRLYVGGAVVGGTSAGAAVMSAIMITGDERRPGGARPDTSLAFVTIDRENIVTTRGLGLLPGTIVDQHFLRRRRHNRLMSLALEHPSLVAVGIDESTAIQVNPGGCWDVLGAGHVVIYDPRPARVTAPGAPLGAAGMKLSVLPAGSRYEPGTGEAVLGSGEMVPARREC